MLTDTRFRIGAPNVDHYEEFRTFGALHGGEVGDLAYLDTGMLPREWKPYFQADEPHYVIYSYGTPIAWHGVRGWVMPAVKYTLTTTRHQSTVGHLLGSRVVRR